MNHQRLALLRLMSSKHPKEILPDYKLLFDKLIKEQKDSTHLIPVNAKPGANKNKIVEEGLVISIAAQPQKGAANTELCRFIASVLKTHKQNISLEAGGKSKRKVVKVSAGANLSCSELVERFLAQLAQ